MKCSYIIVRFRIFLRKEVVWVYVGKSINDVFIVVGYVYIEVKIDNIILKIKLYCM